MSDRKTIDAARRAQRLSDRRLVLGLRDLAITASRTSRSPVSPGVAVEATGAWAAAERLAYLTGIALPPVRRDPRKDSRWAR